jgi:hypothetical protein
MGPSTQVTDAQPKQRFWPMLGEAERPAPVDDILIAQCDTLLDAVLLCVQLSRLPHYVVCQRLGIDRGHWSRILQGQAHFPTNKFTALMQLCRNLAPMQYLARATGVPLLLDQKAQRKAALLRELEMLEAA